ncbi:MAG: polysaccharide deacetylase family protein [Deltaproteobacteria bacterium]|nr:polysaccharide deacetylase family protein [Deltaproteobacteria bacterium]
MVLTPLGAGDPNSEADINQDGRIAGPEEFEQLHRLLSSHPGGAAGALRTIGSVRQAEAPGGRLEPTLGARQRLADVPQLMGIASGIGALRKAAGPTLGTGSVQDALNTIATRLSDHSSCRVDTEGGRYRGYFGTKTEAAVKAFQAQNDLPETGEVDATTLAAIDAQLAKARTTQVNDIRNVSSSELRGIFYGDRFGKNVNLTFDDGPHPRITPEVLRILDEEGVKGATFFVLGQNVARYPALVRDIIQKGHVIGNHTWDHANLTHLSADEIRSQLRKTQAAVNEAVGHEYKIKHMRPPYGATNARVKEVVAQEGLNLIMWQVDSEDWKNRSTPERVLSNIFEGAYSVNGRGGAVLFHDIQPATEQELRQVVRGLKSRDFKLTSTQSLLDAKYA